MVPGYKSDLHLYNKAVTQVSYRFAILYKIIHTLSSPIFKKYVLSFYMHTVLSNSCIPRCGK